jgi:putative acetyltransferase
MLQIVKGDLEDPRIVDLVRHHRATAAAETAPGSAHAFDISGLKAPEVAFFAAMDEGDILGIGALHRLDAGHGEVKSMHTVAAARRRGVGAAMLAHIMGQARAMGLTRLSLETGSWPYFRPAVALYAAHGFEICGPFGSYREDPNSLFMTCDLARQGS